MPIFYNFHILLATFYIIFGTNILNQCPVLVPVCCMFYVSQKTHIKRSPNVIKTDGEYFCNKRNPVDLEWTSSNKRGGHEGARRAPHPHGQGVGPLTLFLSPIFFINYEKLLCGFLGHSENFYFCIKITPWQFYLKQRQYGF